jgi:hypothetical protein
MKSIKQLVRECIEEQLIDNLLDEDYPTNWNIDEFKQLKSYAQRVNYCEKNLLRISSGSSRIVYKIDNEKVLKLAKNNKGLAQNQTEASFGNGWYFKSILAHTFDADEQDYWVEMELARKVKPSDFKRITGVDINTLGYYLRDREAENKGRRLWSKSLDPETEEALHDNEFVSAITDFMISMDSPAGDLARLNSYGLVHRDGGDAIVLIDFGLTHDIYQTHYAPKPSKLRAYYQ